MSIFFLWFNMIAFTLMFAATGCSVIRYIKTPLSWQRNYIFYQLCWAFWLLLSTFSFFQQSFIPNPGPELNRVLSWIRIAISFIIFILLPTIIYSADGRRWKIWQAVLSSVILLIMVSLYLINSTLTSVVILNSGFHLFLAAITISGYRRYRRIQMSEKKIFFENFLALTSIYFVTFTILNISFLIYPNNWEQEIGIATLGVFTLSWSLTDIIRFIQDWKLETDQTIVIPENWGISPREVEVVKKIITGATNKEISEELFISMRTVETHLYSIYRKCGVKNKIELLHKLERR